MDVKPGEKIEVRMSGVVDEVVKDIKGERYRIALTRKDSFGFTQYVSCDASAVWTAQNEVEDVKG